MKRSELKSKYFKIRQCMILNCIKSRKTTVANCIKRKKEELQ